MLENALRRLRRYQEGWESVGNFGKIVPRELLELGLPELVGETTRVSYRRGLPRGVVCRGTLMTHSATRTQSRRREEQRGKTCIQAEMRSWDIRLEDVGLTVNGGDMCTAQSEPCTAIPPHFGLLSSTYLPRCLGT